MSDSRKVSDAVEALIEKINEKPEVGLILGSGLGMLADQIEDRVVIPYRDVPGFPVSTVSGHKGQLVFGRLEGVSVAAMQGRFHFYEGYSLREVTFPIRVMKQLGVETLIVTNAAGGVNETYKPGDLMLICDHINGLSANPLTGKNDERFGVRFPDMSEAYSKSLRRLAIEAAAKFDLSLQEGVYLATSGPCYETPAEIRMMRKLGADAVGMSTVPEVISARHAGIEVLGISCITNAGAGILDVPLTHDEVIETTERIRDSFMKLVKAILKLRGRVTNGSN
ncbi:MAG TPA: purine-nucleoside phosphorylase [Bacillales bacterium]|nr:purine-nucleoside phosphorylase [Bacillales bacterium]